MKCMCRVRLTPSLERRSLGGAEVLRRVTIVTDPRKLAYLKAEVKKRQREVARRVHEASLRNR
jgi:hypothetical protein